MLWQKKLLGRFLMLATFATTGALLVIGLLTLATSETKSDDPGCDIHINYPDTRGRNEPMFLKPNFAHGNDAFYLPNERGIVSLQADDVVRLACPGSKVIISGYTTSYEIVSAICKSGKYSIDDQLVSYTSITCQEYRAQPTSSPATKLDKTNHCQGVNYQGYDLGFEVGGDFYKQMDICFDNRQYNTLYSEYTLVKTIKGRQFGTARPQFSQGSNIYTINVNDYYKIPQHQKTINKLVDLPEDSTQYVIPRNSKLHLSRGHLTAMADFVYRGQQRSTFDYINAAPQWQTFNEGNWNSLENDLRDYAHSNAIHDLTVYTGTYGVMTLPHNQTGENVEIFLYVSGDERKIPVPAQYWKVVYDKASKAGVALLGINNPYSTDFVNESICDDVCKKLDWIAKTWDRMNNADKGYVYCCKVDDFRDKSNIDLPLFEVIKLLN